MISFLGLSPALDITYLVREVIPGMIHRPHDVFRLPGGKSLNAARAAATLFGSAQSGSVRTITPLGGFTGSQIGAALEADGIRADIVRVARETRSCVSAFDESTESLTEFYEPAADLDDVAWAAISRAVEDVADGWLAVSGSMPVARATELAALLTRASARGVRVAVDTHGEALRIIMDASEPTVVKVNRAEAAEFLGGFDADGDGDAAADAADLARELRVRGADVAIVTDGAAGSVLASREGCLRAAPPERGRFTVGSGDCFLGGLLVGLDGGSTMSDALALATAAATANTFVPGAGLFALEHVQRLRRSVVVRAA